MAALRLLLGAAALGLWEVSAREGWVDRFFFSAPSDVGRTLWTLVASAALYPHLLPTIQEALGGLILGFVAGIFKNDDIASLRFADFIRNFIGDYVIAVLKVGKH